MMLTRREYADAETRAFIDREGLNLQEPEDAQRADAYWNAAHRDYPHDDYELDCDAGGCDE